MKTLNLNVVLKEKLYRICDDCVGQGSISNPDSKDEQNKVIPCPHCKQGRIEFTPIEAAIYWYSDMMERAINATGADGRPTVAPKMETLRVFGKVIDALKDHKEGVVTMTDELFDFLDKKFHQAGIPAQKKVIPLLMQLEDELNKAKIEKKE